MRCKQIGFVLVLLLALSTGAANDAVAQAGQTFGEPTRVAARENQLGSRKTDPLRPQKGADKWGDSLRIEESETHEIHIKFLDTVRARWTPELNQLMVTSAEADALDALTKRFQISFRPLLQISEEKLLALELRAAQRSGQAQPDFAGIMIADIPDKGAPNTRKIAEALRALDMVEYVEIEITSRPPPPPTDYPPTTADLSGFQDYRPPDPGIDIEYAWSLGFKGSGIRFSDCEYGFNTNHEDLVDTFITPEPGQTMHPLVFTNGYDEHGTAVLGILGATENGYGMNGLVPQADINFYSEWTVQRGLSRSTAVGNALADSAAGDVVLLEMQTTGAGGDYGPAEYDLTIWNLVKTASDAGVIVVAAAGNGAQDLDSAVYSNYMARGDSGALIVGGGTADTAHNKRASSTYGARVNVQGWGVSVETLGYGSRAEYGGDKNQRYANGFNGTSSAAALAAGACVVLQNYCEQTFGFRLSPLQMRQLLVSTGIPQGTGGHIGPLPDIQAAIQSEDIESDGLPDSWELLYQTNLVIMGSASDSDSDGQTDRQEWIAMTVPTNGTSSFRVDGFTIQTNGSRRILHWASASNRVYDVGWKSNAASEFAGITGSLPATPPVNSYTDNLHVAESEGYYRIDVRLGP